MLRLILVVLLGAVMGQAATAQEVRIGRQGEAPGPWRADVFYGFVNPDNFTDIMFLTHKTRVSGEDRIGFSVGREVADLGYGFGLELGVLYAHRIEEGGHEFALPITFSFDGLPWRDVLPMRLRVTVAPSFTTRISNLERRKDSKNQGSKVLNMFNPEVELGLPWAPEWSAFFALHHRSGIFKLIDGVTGGSTYMTFGARKRFAIQ